MRFFVQFNAHDEAPNVSFWDMAHLLVIHHAATGSVQELLDAAFKGAYHTDMEGVARHSVQALPWARAEADDTPIEQAKEYLRSRLGTLAI